MVMVMGFVAPAALALLCVVLAACEYSLIKSEKIALQNRMLIDEDLYARGKDEAVARTRPPRLPVPTAFREAGMTATPLLWLARVAALALAASALASTLCANALVGALAACAVAAGACGRVALARKRRRALLDQQFTRLLPQVSAGARSSLTLERALRVAAVGAQDPLRAELVRVLADAAYGTSLATAFEEMANRTGDPDIRALAAAIRIQQRFGGAIAPVLDLVADHANARLKASRELRTELAGTRLAKWFVAAAMPAIFLVMFASSADFARFYVEEPLGWAVLGMAAASEAAGLFACQRITALDGDRCGDASRRRVADAGRSRMRAALERRGS